MYLVFALYPLMPPAARGGVVARAVSNSGIALPRPVARPRDGTVLAQCDAHFWSGVWDERTVAEVDYEARTTRDCAVSSAWRVLP